MVKHNFDFRGILDPDPIFGSNWWVRFIIEFMMVANLISGPTMQRESVLCVCVCVCLYGVTQ